MDSEEGRGRSRERSGRTRRRRGSAERYGNGSGTGLGPARRRAEVANMIERARARIDKAVAETNPQQGGRRARRARTRKAVKKSLHA
jgi:hypothetical protein